MDKEIITFINENSEYLLIQFVDGHDIEVLENEYKIISNGVNVPFSLVAVKVNNWNDELSPWEAPAVFGKQNFGGGAGETLRYITDELLPKIKKDYGITDDTKFIIGGYSLAALFALWCGYNTDMFYGVAAASPSVWFNGWIDYGKANGFRAEKVYLSLGDKEEKTRNQTMATVGENIKKQEQIFKEKNIPCTLEWNEGNHFKDSELRTAKAFISLMQSN